MWQGNDEVFRTYLAGSGKSPSYKGKLKGKKHILNFSEAEKKGDFGALLSAGYVDISFDSVELSDMFWEMCEANEWECLVIDNPASGHIHSFWRKPEGWKHRDGKDKTLAVGLVADVHSNDTYIPLRADGNDRFPPIYEPREVSEVPEELFPVKTNIDLVGLKEGDGRNDELFKYILVLQGAGMDKETIRRVLKNANEFILPSLWTQTSSTRSLATSRSTLPHFI